MSQKLCARYTLGARYLYFKWNVEKFGVRVNWSENMVYCKNHTLAGTHHPSTQTTSTKNIQMYIQPRKHNTDFKNHMDYILSTTTT